MVRWEYMWAEHDDVGRFCELGEDGWELIAFDASGRAWFKRPLGPRVS